VSASIARFAVLTGPIASGKSTIGRLAVQGTSFPFVCEDVDSSPADREVLARYYRAVQEFETLASAAREPDAGALAAARAVIFRTQEHFIRKRAVPLRGRALEGHGGLVERHPSDDIEVFSRRNLAKGLLTEDQFAALGKLMEAELTGVPPPMLTIFLHASPGRLRERIRLRARPQEIDLVDPGNLYLEELDELYERWFARCPTDKVRIETDALTEEAAAQAVRRELASRALLLTSGAPSSAS
jgi:deoxyadenosine/deoxycytidine kinase